MNILLLGAPGSGKGTQGQRLADHYGLPHIATGDLIRAQIADGTEFGKKVEADIAAGNFASDTDMASLVGQRLSEPDAEAGYILDGYPRDTNQARALDAKSSEHRALDLAIELIVPSEVVVDRLAGRLVCPICDRIYHEKYKVPKNPGYCDFDGEALVRRPDDHPDAVRHRIAVYEKLTLPLRAYFEAQDILRQIDATGSADIVFQQLLAVTQPVASEHKNARVRV